MLVIIVMCAGASLGWDESVDMQIARASLVNFVQLLVSNVMMRVDTRNTRDPSY